MKEKLINIAGMHCKSCEILIGEELSKLPEIKRAEVFHKNGTAKIWFFIEPEESALKKAVKNAGYKLENHSQKPFFNLNELHLKDISIALVAIIGLYLILAKTNFFNNGFNISGNYTSLSVVLLVGLTAGFSTCMTLIGGLVLGVSARFAENNPSLDAKNKFIPHIYFNIGRIIGFAVLGGLAGIIGSKFQFSSISLGILMILVGIVMTIIGLQLTEIFPRLSSSSFTLPVGISKLLGITKRKDNQYSHSNSFLLGVLTFFIPCGFTQAMQLFAISTGSFMTGALVMSIFALGTTPGLLAIGGLTIFSKGNFKRRFFKFAGMVVILFALMNIKNGFTLTGWKNISFKNTAATSAPLATVIDGKQIINMTQSASGYSPNNFTVVKDIPVKWIIQATETSSCSSSITISKLNIKKILAEGENVIEFTPNEIGTTSFSCLMGMYRGKINVVENSTPSTSDQSASPSPLAVTTNTPEIQATPTPTPSSTLIPKSVENKPSPKQKQSSENLVVFNTTYTLDGDLTPNIFTASPGDNIEMNIDVKEDGLGCMSTIIIPGFVDEPVLFEKNKPIKFNFKIDKPGVYDIACAMGVVRGVITVN